jgi:hypothetical protein
MFPEDASTMFTQDAGTYLPHRMVSFSQDVDYAHRRFLFLFSPKKW